MVRGYEIRHQLKENSLSLNNLIVHWHGNFSRYLQTMANVFSFKNVCRVRLATFLEYFHLLITTITIHNYITLSPHWMVRNGSLENHEELEVLMLHRHALVVLRALISLTNEMLWLRMRHFCRYQIWKINKFGLTDSHFHLKPPPPLSSKPCGLGTKESASRTATVFR